MNKENKIQPYPYVLTPFQLCCLQNFPFIEADFDSLTYYQLLCKIVQYLNEVIANQNIVQNNVTELNNAYVTLKSYVDNYFTNLDVQEEINNKLDEMSESGELQEIIDSYLKLKSLLCYDTVNDMKNGTNFTNGSFAQTLGYHIKNDGGQGLYKIRLYNEEEDYIDEGSLILLNDNLVAELITSNLVNVKQFGAYGDGITDDKTYIQKAINYCSDKKTLYMDHNEYYISGEINITTDNVNFQCDGSLIINNDYVACKIRSLYSNIYIHNITNKLGSSNRQGIGVRIMQNSAFNNIRIDEIFNTAYGIVLSNIFNKGIFYNKIYSNRIEANTCIYFNAKAGFINQNYFDLGNLVGNMGIYSEPVIEDDLTSKYGEYNGNTFVNIGFENIYQCVSLNDFNYGTFKNFRIFESITGDQYWFLLYNSKNNLFESNTTSAILQQNRITTQDVSRDQANIFNCYITQYGSTTSDRCRSCLVYNNLGNQILFEVTENISLPETYTDWANNSISLMSLSSLSLYTYFRTYSSEADTILTLDERYNYSNKYTDNLIIDNSYIGANHSCKVLDSNGNTIFDIQDFLTSGEISVGKRGVWKLQRAYNNSWVPILIYKN